LAVASSLELAQPPSVKAIKPARTNVSARTGGVVSLFASGSIPERDHLNCQDVTQP
jgi:hypothetical protein